MSNQTDMEIVSQIMKSREYNKLMEIEPSIINKMNILVKILRINEYDEKLIKYLINITEDLNKPNKYGETSLYYSILNENLFVTKLLVKKGVNLNLKYYTKSILHVIVYGMKKNSLEFLKLVTTKENINMRNSDNKTALIIAIKKKKIDCVKYLINIEGCDIDTVTTKNRSALYYAYNADNLELCKLLIQKGVNIDLKYYRDRTLLMIAIIHNKKKFTKLLINNNCNINIRDRDNFTALYYAYKEKNIKLMENLIDLGANINLQYNNNNTILYFAIDDNRKDVINLLLKKNCDINIKCYANITVANRAIRNGKKKLYHRLLNHPKCNHGLVLSDVIKYKIDHAYNIILNYPKCNLNIINSRKENILMQVISKKDQYLTNMLINDKRINLNFVNKRGNIINYLVEYKMYNILKRVLKTGQNINIVTKPSHRTPLIQATQNHNTKIVTLLLKHRFCKINAQTSKGHTALTIAAEYGQYFALFKKILHHKKCNINITTNFGNSAIYIATREKNILHIIELIKAGCDMSIRNKRGDTPLDIAKYMVKIIIMKGMKLKDWCVRYIRANRKIYPKEKLKYLNKNMRKYFKL